MTDKTKITDVKDQETLDSYIETLIEESDE